MLWLSKKPEKWKCSEPVYARTPAPQCKKTSEHRAKNASIVKFMEKNGSFSKKIMGKMRKIQFNSI